MYIKPNSEAVYEIGDKTHLFLETKKEKYDLMGKIKKQIGYIYTFQFDGTSVILEDARPLVKIGEQSWSVKLDEKSSVKKLISSKNGDFFYYIDNFIDKNENSALFRMASLDCLKADGGKNWTTPLNARNGDLTLYDMAVCENDTFLVGQKTNQSGEYAFSALYSETGKQLDTKEFVGASSFDALAKLSENSFLIVGNDETENPILLKATINENKIHYEQISFHSEKLDSEIYQIVPFFDESENAIYLFCNRQNEEGDTLPSSAYQLCADGKLNNVPLDSKIQSVSSACKIGDSILLGGETVSSTNSSAIALKLNPNDKITQILYQDENPYSYISKMNFNPKTNALVVSGTINAKTSSGSGGRPFILALNSETGKEIWKTVYPDEEGNLILDFVPCDDYGFVELFCDVADDSLLSKKIIRANATGKYK